MFDYIFYRLYVFYNKKEKGISPISTATIYLTFFQALIVFFIYMMINFSLNQGISTDKFQINKTYFKISITIVAILIQTLNYFYYKKKLDKIKLRYQSSSVNKKFKLWMFVVLCLGLFTLPFIYKVILDKL